MTMVLVTFHFMSCRGLLLFMPQPSVCVLAEHEAAREAGALFYIQLVAVKVWWIVSISQYVNSRQQRSHHTLMDIKAAPAVCLVRDV